jgi:membrane-associated protease RseP (regulator of RpoE activity)
VNHPGALSNDTFVSSPLPALDVPAEPAGPVWRVPEPPRRFQHVVWKHVLLFLLTLATTTLVGANHYAAFLSEFRREQIEVSWTLLAGGLWYSLTIMAILGAHEMGHYLACRWYQVDATLPFFLPLPPFIFISGTLGAVIRIREPFPTRTVLFDIGIAGPIAGFLVLVPALFLGFSLSNIVPAPTNTTELIYLGEPLLFRGASQLIFGTVADGYTVNMHPMVMAAWFGMLATSLNLLPFGQLDGGHITYATLGRWSTPISLATVAIAIAMTMMSLSWVVMTIMMVVMVYLLGPGHPRVMFEYEPLGRGRPALAVFALIMLILCFTPVPISFPK